MTAACSALLSLAALSAADAAPVSQELQQQAHEIGQYLRCPVCQGMPIAESPSSMAQDMMKRVRQMLAAGKSRQEILAYFERRYGQWALLEPKAEGFNWLVWLAPPLFLLAALLGLWRWARRVSRPATAAHGAAGAEAAPPGAATADDPYLQAVRQEAEQ